MWGLEHCICHHIILEHISDSWVYPPAIIEFLKENIPQIETLKRIEDEEYVKKTYDNLEKITDDDPDIDKIMTLIFLFLPCKQILAQKKV